MKSNEIPLRAENPDISFIEKWSNVVGKTPEEVDLVRGTLFRLYDQYGAYVLEDKPILFLSNLQKAFGSLFVVRGKRILDVACGSVASEKAHALTLELTEMKRQGIDIEHTSQYRALQQEITPYTDIDFDTGEIGRSFEPWLPRILEALGAEAVGIDVGNLDGEPFEHHRLDLRDEHALDVLSDKSFDAVNARLLPDVTSDETEQESFLHRVEVQIKGKIKNGGKLIELN